MKVFAVALLVGALCAQSGQGVPQNKAGAGAGAKIKYFAPTNPGVNSNAGCEIASNEQTLAFDKIFTTKDKLSLCVYFTAPDRWFYHTGSLGNCGADQCCEWLPPPAHNGDRPAPPPAIKEKWFVIPEDGNCDIVPQGNLQRAPMLRREVNSKFTVCFNPNTEETDKWFKEPVEILEGNAGANGCAIWTFSSVAAAAAK